MIKLILHTLFTILILLTVGCAISNKNTADKFIHLEEIESQENLKWVQLENNKTESKITTLPNYASNLGQILSILDDKEKIPYISIRGNYVFNFWRDKKNVRGIWRRTTLVNFKKKNPNWETLLDIDLLSKKENKNWVFKGSRCLETDLNYCLISLSNGGKDATVLREFNLKNKNFVENGFYLPEAKNKASWVDKNHLYVGTNWGENSLSKSGYARFAKLLKRGQPLSDAKTIGEVSPDNMTITAYRYFGNQKNYDLLIKSKDFYNTKKLFIHNDELIPINVPSKSQIIEITKNHLFLKIEENWSVSSNTYEKDSILSIQFKDTKIPNIDLDKIKLIYEPNKKSSLMHFAVLKNYIVINELNNIKGKLLYFDKSGKDNFILKNINFTQDLDIKLYSSSKKSNVFTYLTSNFNSPSRLNLYNLEMKKDENLKSLKEKFNSKDIVVMQKWAVSKDGTKVPYFLVGKKSIIEKGNAPTELYGYGGFNYTLRPYYSSITGKLWLEKGGLYVLANIRGGGEFGTQWHQSAILHNKQRSYDDFIAIAEDLIKKGLTSSKKLAISGGSNGGLLVGAVMTQRPDLFALVNCNVPLLDMLRYHKLLAGSSWIAEYGNPDIKKDRDYILTYSPYQNLKEKTKYPTTLFYTSTKDDRVHPGHARKMVAKMKSMKISNVYYYENLNGGHAGSSNNNEAAARYAMKFTFMAHVLGLE